MREERLSSEVTSTRAGLVFWNGAATCLACSRMLEAAMRTVAELNYDILYMYELSCEIHDIQMNQT